MSTDESPEPKSPETEKPDDIHENILTTRAVQSPLLWFLLLFVPIALALVSGLVRQSKMTEAERQAVRQVAVERPERPVPIEKTIMRTRAGVDQDLRCDFDHLVGSKVTEEFLKGMRPLGRPVRVLPPDLPVPAGQTPEEFDPRRLNFDVDQNDLIRRIWCG